MGFFRILRVNDQRDQVNGLSAFVGNAVSVAGLNDCRIAGIKRIFRAVIVVYGLTLQQVKQLTFALVHMIADGGAGLKMDIGKQSALIAKLSSRNKMSNANRTVATLHIYVYVSFTFICFNDHDFLILLPLAAIAICFIISHVTKKGKPSFQLKGLFCFKIHQHCTYGCSLRTCQRQRRGRKKIHALGHFQKAHALKQHHLLRK